MFNSITRTLIVYLAAPLLFVSTAMAEDRGTPDEAQAMAEEAAAFYQAEGADAAFEAFNNSPDFHDRDLYVFALDGDGNMAAHGANHNLIGQNVVELRDPSGREFIREFLAIEESGWVDYQWPHPESGDVENKTSYIINVGDHVLGVGAYE